MSNGVSGFIKFQNYYNLGSLHINNTGAPRGGLQKLYTTVQES